MAVRPYISIYIDGQEADMKEPMELHLTYAHQDLHNPTVVKNGFSKTIVFDGTPNNNRIFGCFGNMDRMIVTEEGKNSGAYYNPSRKVDVVIMRNYEIIDRGYLKLDSVKKIGKRLEYHTTFYSGLGQFLYNLQYRDDGEQMKLSDLDYGYELNMNINKDVVIGAWQHITEMKQDSSTEIYNHINFAPCYNGIPEDFSADKVAIDVSSFTSDEDLYNSFLKEKDGYGLVDGWLIAELEKEYDEWKVGDLRSYLQRPVIRFKDIIGACCNPSNNGGFEVDLDEEFFSADNPYYESAWMTLPLIGEIDMGTNDGVESAYLTNEGGKIKITGVEDGTVLKSLKMPMTMQATANANGAFYLYTGVQITLNPSRNHWVESYNACRYAQLVVYDSNNNVVNGSNVISFFTNITNATNFTYQPEYKTVINEVTGCYVNAPSTNTYVFNAEFYEFTIKNFEWKEGYYMKVVVKSAEIKNYEDLGEKVGINYLYKRNEYHKAEETVTSVSWLGGVDTNLFTLEAKKEVNKHISKYTLLNSENTPCDYFLSYLKMFNLHIWSDNVEKKIYVRQRKNYFIDNIINIDGMVDRDSDIDIKPIIYDAKWYNFNTEFDGDSILNKTYKDNYGFDYGIQKVNTNYNFDSSSKDLLEKSVFKNCICQRAKSKYYVSTRYKESNSAFDVPSFYLDGFTTYLFNGEGDTVEGSKITPKTTAVSRDWWTEKYYDFMPKPEFRDKDGKGVDGANVLLFYNGRTLIRDKNGEILNINVTDDIPQFEQLNEGEPCWIWTYNWQIADNTTIGGSPYYGDGYMPCFSRYLTNENGWVTHSWDFGTPKEIYIPDYNIDNSSDIYTQYWKPYIQDEFNMNTREVDLKVLLLNKVNPDYLQNFVYFDGCIWKIMEITDYNPCSQETTKVKLVKVQDKNNYLI